MGTGTISFANVAADCAAARLTAGAARIGAARVSAWVGGGKVHALTGAATAEVAGGAANQGRTESVPPRIVAEIVLGATGARRAAATG
jgi:hypothetical protein